MGTIKLVEGVNRFLLIDETDDKCRIELEFDTFEEAQKQFNDWIDELAGEENEQSEISG